MEKKVPIDLQKKSDLVTQVLRERGMRQAPIVRVGAALDISGSMSTIIHRGDLQKAVDQLGGVAIKFDDNGEIDMWKFDDRCDYIGTWTPEDHLSYVRDKNISSRGGTEYTPFIKEINKFMFGGKSGGSVLGRFFGGSKPANTMPALIMVVTDGAPFETQFEVEAALKATNNNPIYWSFVGVGPSGGFGLISSIANKLENVGFINLSTFGLDDSVVYNQLINDELVDWLKKFPTP